MPLTIAICDDNENQIKEMRRLLAEWSADKPFALDIDVKLFKLVRWFFPHI